MFKLNMTLILPFILTSCFEKKQEPVVTTDSSRPKHFLEFYYPKATYTPGVFDGNAEPPYPDLDEDVKTLEGIDADKDGLRDDLEIWINRISKDENERNLWRQAVRMKTETITSSDDDKTKGLKYLWAGQNIIACGALLVSSDYNKMNSRNNKLIDLIMNTKIRTKFYTKNVNAASPYNGGFATNKESLFLRNCFCNFEIKNQQDVIERFQVYEENLFNLSSEKIVEILKGFEERNKRGYYEDFFGISDYKSCLDVAVE